MNTNTLALLQIAFSLGQDKLIEGLHNSGYKDIRPVHGKVFAFIDREKGSLLVELAKRAKVSKQFMSQLIKEVEELGYVKKINHHTDKRAYLVTLTTKGKQAVMAADIAVVELEAWYKKQLTNDDYQKLRQLLSKLCFLK